MNILLTNLCNGKCPYCFAADTMYGETGRERENEISLENLSVALDYLYYASPNQEIRLLWGEPTKHSRLEEVIELIVRKGFRTIMVFSNGIIEEKTKPALRKYRDFLTFVWNLNPPGLYPSVIENKIEDSIREFDMPNSCLGFNIYHDQYDTSFALEALERHKHLTRIRIGIAHPMGTENPANPQKAIYVKDYPKVGAMIRNFVLEVARNPKCSQVSHIDLDCGYAPCLWTKEELEELRKIEIFDIHEEDSGCGPEITDFTTELEVRPCFTKAESQNPKKYLSDFHTIEQAVQYNVDRYWIAREFLPPASAKCLGCPDRKNCFWGCGWERMLQAKLKLAKAEFRLKSAKNRKEKVDALYEIGTLQAACYDYNAAVWALKEAENTIRFGFDFARKAKIRTVLEKFKIVSESDKYANDRLGVEALRKDFEKNRKEGVFDKRLANAYTGTLVNACFDWKFSVRKGFFERVAEMPEGPLRKWKNAEVRKYLKAMETMKFRIDDPWVLLGYVAISRFALGDEKTLESLKTYFERKPMEREKMKTLVDGLVPDGIIGDVTADLMKRHFAP